ncbi:hypothetical protein [Plasticicumulans sp.]|uniref:hypothetical protein n=1 Tax=Plasticicumulans sp. TaxID=2307179 RepID=UPI002B620202|nr:hypothetical protein [Plasticicumulans sp.]MBS0599870.1 hypothetical protein [Pseudomonadota bacterium]HMW29149.1 hypothetical protein [Plasticicumulans sp.]HMW43248.1 hypothetical protein [Plasticicumulans sp.]HMX53470.1 hypothetical protein [Plasticicumulans sp.]HMZ10514.1 hypothetical protein [Plasticicumulans sp.]
MDRRDLPAPVRRHAQNAQKKAGALFALRLKESIATTRYRGETSDRRMLQCSIRMPRQPVNVGIVIIS